MKLTKKKLVALIEQEMKDFDGDRRPWYHGPWESNWDREQKEEECRTGNEEVCRELEDSEGRWNRIVAKIVGDPIPEENQ